MKTFLLKSGLVISIVLVLMLYLSGAPMSAAAAVVTLVWSPTTSPGSFDYGTLDFGDTSSQQFTLTDGRNSGTLTASLSGSPAFSITSDGCTGARLGRNPSCAVTVQYAPTGSGGSDTATLSASNKKGDSASLTLTGASTAPCTISAAISPDGGEKVARPYLIEAYDANGCGVPLEYHWNCNSQSDLQGCVDFLLLANAGQYGSPSATLIIGEFSTYVIDLDLCQIGTSNCSNHIAVTYIGIPF